MNTNQKFPGNGSPVPVLVIIGLGFALVNWLLSDDDTEKKPETTPANTEAENRRKEAEISAFRQIPPEIPVKPAAAPPVQKITTPAPLPAAVASPKSTTQAPLPQAKKKFVTREDLAAVFQRGARTLTRTAAVAALKRLGFGKTAAYEALSANGRFCAWLDFQPDGIITWRE